MHGQSNEAIDASERSECRKPKKPRLGVTAPGALLYEPPVAPRVQ